MLHLEVHDTYIHSFFHLFINKKLHCYIIPATFAVSVFCSRHAGQTECWKSCSLSEIFTIFLSFFLFNKKTREQIRRTLCTFFFFHRAMEGKKVLGTLWESTGTYHLKYRSLTAPTDVDFCDSTDKKPIADRICTKILFQMCKLYKVCIRVLHLLIKEGQPSQEALQERKKEKKNLNRKRRAEL